MLRLKIQITKVYERLFKLEDWQLFRTHYRQALIEWLRNFNKIGIKLEFITVNNSVECGIITC